MREGEAAHDFHEQLRFVRQRESDVGRRWNTQVQSAVGGVLYP
jgi:hypothetical protein